MDNDKIYVCGQCGCALRIPIRYARCDIDDPYFKANVPINKCSILGWSLGGQVAMSLAIRMPEFVSMSHLPDLKENKFLKRKLNAYEEFIL